MTRDQPCDLQFWASWPVNCTQTASELSEGKGTWPASESGRRKRHHLPGDLAGRAEQAVRPDDGEQADRRWVRRALPSHLAALR
jgi:hypothetical protein